MPADLPLLGWDAWRDLCVGKYVQESRSLQVQIRYEELEFTFESTSEFPARFRDVTVDAVKIQR
jgi:hypothetical protein